MPAHDSNTVVIGGRELSLAPLTLKFIRKLTEGKLLETIQGIKGLPTGKQIDAIVELIISSVGKNHSDVTKDWLEDNIEPLEIPTIIMSVLTASGMVGKQSGEALSQ
jgi:hypothetical protein